MRHQIYKIGSIITVNDRMQQGYEYKLVAPVGKKFAEGFYPFLTPKKMLELGVFEGKYCNDCHDELPESWFEKAKISAIADTKLNCFGMKSRQSLQVWRDNGWIIAPDPRGWFQWYYRYYLGRRIFDVDERQIKRWHAFTRHVAQIKGNCWPHDFSCRPRQRQALLQWSYDPFI